jgi:hypothetical protein
MGLWIRAFSQMSLTEPHEVTDACFDVEPYHRRSFIYDGHDQSLRGLVRDRCYAPTEGTVQHEILSLSYTGYGAWRANLSWVALGVAPETVWRNLDDYRDRPFFEVIHFADNEGVIGPEAAADLLADFEAAMADGLRDRFAAALPNGWDIQHRAHYAALLDDWVIGLRLAADGGLVFFS